MTRKAEILGHLRDASTNLTHVIRAERAGGFVCGGEADIWSANWTLVLNTYRLSRSHDTEGESPHSRAGQAWLNLLRRPLRAATVKVAEVASRSLRPAGLRRPAFRRAAVAAVQGSASQ